MNMNKNIEQDFEIPKLPILGTIKEAIALYKDNLKLFLTISFIAFLINIITIISDYIKKFIQDPTVGLLYLFFSYVLIFATLYYGIKISITMYICISERYKNRKIEIKDAYSRVNEKIWRYIGVSIQYFLIIAVPLIIFICTILFVKQLTLKITLIVIFAIPTIYLGTKYGFAPYVVVLENDKRRYFEMSKTLVKGDFGRIVILTFVTTIVFSIPYYTFTYIFNDFRHIPEFHKFLALILNRIIFIFATPFTYSISVVLYFKLKNNKRIG